MWGVQPQNSPTREKRQRSSLRLLSTPLFRFGKHLVRLSLKMETRSDRSRRRLHQERWRHGLLRTCGWRRASGSEVDRNLIDSVHVRSCLSTTKCRQWLQMQLTIKTNYPPSRIEVRPAALLRYHAHTRWTFTVDFDLWPWLSIPGELRGHGHTYTQNHVQKSVDLKDRVKTNGRTEGRTDGRTVRRTDRRTDATDCFTFPADVIGNETINQSMTMRMTVTYRSSVTDNESQRPQTNPRDTLRCITPIVLNTKLDG